MIEKSAVAEHAWENHHLIHWEETTVASVSQFDASTTVLVCCVSGIHIKDDSLFTWKWILRMI